MAWVTHQYLEHIIGTTAVSALGLQTADVFNKYEKTARSTVIATMQYAGYSSPGTSIDQDTMSGAFLASLVAGLIIRDAFQYRKGVRLPFDPSGTITEALMKLDAIYNKKLPIPEMTPDLLGGYGGNESSSPVGTNARPTYFGPGKLSGF